MLPSIVEQRTRRQSWFRLFTDGIYHVAHDCIVGDNVIMSNLSTLGGHVEVGDWAILGGGVLVHQFTKIGSHVLIGGGFRAVQDVHLYISSRSSA